MQLKIKTQSKYLTKYYLEEYFESNDESGFIFDNEDNDNITLEYVDKEDLERKLSFILMILTDK